MAYAEGGGLRFEDRMSDLEALLWSLETHQPVLASNITVVVTFDHRPDPAAVSARIDRLSRSLPRLRDRVVTSPVPTAPPRWEGDPDFDLTRHLVPVAAIEPVTFDGLLRLAGSVAGAPLDRDRPLWKILHVDGSEGRGAGALIVKLHHTFTDGLGAVKLAGSLFDLERVPPPAPEPAPLPEVDPSSMLGRLWDDLAFEAERSLAAARRVLPWLTIERPTSHDSQAAAQTTLDLLHSLGSLATAASGPGSPALDGRSPEARFGALAYPLPELRQRARRAGGTVNDVFLAGVIGGLRQYHAKLGYFPPWLRMGIPISTRDAGTEADMRNQFVPMLVRAPLQVEDAAARVRDLHDLVAAARHQPLLDLLEQASGLLRRLPGSARLVAGLLGSIDLMASNVPGSPVDLYLGGAKVEQIVPFGPRGGSGLNLTLLSHVDTVHIGVNMDPAAIEEPGILMDCLRSGFDETLA